MSNDHSVHHCQNWKEMKTVIFLFPYIPISYKLIKNLNTSVFKDEYFVFLKTIRTLCRNIVIKYNTSIFMSTNSNTA